MCRRRRCSLCGLLLWRVRIELGAAAARRPGRDAYGGGDQRRAALKDPMLLVDGSEQIDVPRDALCRAQEQIAVGLERVVENGQHVVLQLGVEIDQQIAARDHVHARERRIADHAVRGEDAQVAHFLGQHVALRVCAEEALQPFRRDVVQHRRGIAAGARHRERGLIDVGGEHLHSRHDIELAHVLAHQQRDRIGFLARRASRHPHADRVAGASMLEQSRDDFGLERCERLRVAEKCSDADQQIAKQQPRLIGVQAQQLQVILERADLAHLHASVHTAQEGLFLVAAEIVADALAQSGVDFLQRPVAVLCAVPLVGIVGDRIESVQAADILLQLRADLLGRQHQVDEPAGHGARWHAVVSRAAGAVSLRDGQAALLLDRLDAERSVGAGSRQDDAHRALVPLLGDRREEDVDRIALALPGFQVLQDQLGPLQRQHVLRRQHVDVACLHASAVRRVHDRHFRAPADDLGEQGLAVSAQMGDDDERSLELVRHRGKQLLQSLHAARRRTDADDEKSIVRLGPSFGRAHMNLGQWGCFVGRVAARLRSCLTCGNSATLTDQRARNPSGAAWIGG